MSTNKGNPYWNVMETMSCDELQNLQRQRLITLLKYLQQNSPFHRDKLFSDGISYQDVKTLEDLIKLPFTSKQDIVYAAENPAYPCGELFCGDPKEILRWHRTSGTTGRSAIYD